MRKPGKHWQRCSSIAWTMWLMEIKRKEFLFLSVKRCIFRLLVALQYVERRCLCQDFRWWFQYCVFCVKQQASVNLLVIALKLKHFIRNYSILIRHISHVTNENIFHSMSHITKKWRQAVMMSKNASVCTRTTSDTWLLPKLRYLFHCFGIFCALS